MRAAGQDTMRTIEQSGMPRSVGFASESVSLD